MKVCTQVKALAIRASKYRFRYRIFQHLRCNFYQKSLQQHISHLAKLRLRALFFPKISYIVTPICQSKDYSVQLCQDKCYLLPHSHQPHRSFCQVQCRLPVHLFYGALVQLVSIHNSGILIFQPDLVPSRHYLRLNISITKTYHLYQEIPKICWIPLSHRQSHSSPLSF